MRTVSIMLVLAGCGFRSGAPSNGHDATIAHDGPVSTDDAALGSDATVIADAAADATIDTCPSGYVALAGATGKYKAYSWSGIPGGDRSQPWTAAATTCSGEGTHLAFPTDASQAGALEAAVTVDPGSPYFWAGVTDAGSEGTWKTSLGATAAYLPWAPGQPNGGTSANCALEAGGKLYDWPCTTPYAFLCACD